jgi:hypothetical protein
LRHNLDAVMERHQLTCTARHRALGDAQVLSAFWSKLRDEVSVERLAAAAQAVTGANKLPAHFPAGLADELPEGPGVYRFFGENDELLYIGKSHSLRARILGHFAHEQTDAKEQKKARQTRRMDWLETAGVLGAQLKEAEWIKTQKPAYNKRVKSGNDSVTMMLQTQSSQEQAARTPRLVGLGAREPGQAAAVQTRGAQTQGALMQAVRFVAVADVQPEELADCFGLFHSHKDARKALTDIARAHSLCLRVLGLEEGSGSCVGYPLLKCKGACVGKEPLLLHNMRVQMAVSVNDNVRYWIATAPVGAASVLAEELAQFGATDIRERSHDVKFQGTLEVGYRACLWSRTATRVLLSLGPSTPAVQKACTRPSSASTGGSISAPGATLACDCSGGNESIRHTIYGSQLLKDAVCDNLRDATGERPNIKPERPDVLLHLHVEGPTALVSVDFSGESLHRRGYRSEGGRAPLKENVAAAVLLRAGWPASTSEGGLLVDPMCGSGTFLTEGH